MDRMFGASLSALAGGDGVRVRQKSLLLLSMLLVAALFSPWAAAAWAPDVDFPEPIGLVNDFANVIDAAEERAINDIAVMLWTSKGVELAVVTVPTTEPLGINSYAFWLFREWGIGDEGEHDGLLVLMGMEAREIRIEVGLGLEGIITDARSGQILDKALSDLKENRFGPGLETIARELAAAVEGYEGEGKEFDLQAVGIAGIGGAYLFLLLFAVIFRQHWLLHLLIRLPLMFLGGGRGRGGNWGGPSGRGGGGFGGFGGGRSGGGGARRKF